MLGIILLVGLYLIATARVKDDLKWWTDSSVYLEQAEYLIRGEISTFYALNKECMDRSYSEYGPYLYPMGFPFALAPAVAVFGRDFIALKYYNLVFLAASYFLFFLWWAKRQNALIIPFLGSVVVGFHSFNLTLVDHLNSEYFFLFLVTLSFYLFDGCKTFRGLIGISILSFLAYLTRDIGMFLVPAFAVIILMKKEGIIRLASIVVPFSILFIGKLLFSPFEGGVHMNRILEIDGEILLLNYSHVIETFKNFFRVSLKPIIDWIGRYSIWSILFVSLGLVLFQSIKNWRKDLPVLIFCLLQIAVILIWPSSYRQGTRFFIPVLPFLVYLLFSATQNLPWRKVSIVFGLVLTIWAGSTVVVARDQTKAYVKNASTFTGDPDIILMFSEIEKLDPPDFSLIFASPRYLRFATGTNSYVIVEREEILHSGSKYYLFLSGVSHGYNPNQDDDEFTLIGRGEKWFLFTIDPK